ncbi:hypothetical protein GQ55_4G330000 [Panicum hallii var. hallii]|uniref:Uncharacterized protein n=1 Tax=Panicum hallii var. hallii TaxID=1504633 RepID=A0A2T7E2M6_9POAL|nr:hypothetical protein GQ55_4G330000 [Panicum hallii var. hallii]
MSAMSSSTSRPPMIPTVSTTSVLPCGLHTAAARTATPGSRFRGPTTSSLGMPWIEEDAEERAGRRVRRVQGPLEVVAVVGPAPAVLRDGGKLPREEGVVRGDAGGGSGVGVAAVELSLLSV